MVSEKFGTQAASKKYSLFPDTILSLWKVWSKGVSFYDIYIGS